MDLKEVDVVGADIENHWYYRSKVKAVENLLSDINPSVILDVGAGSGFFSKKLLSAKDSKQAWCVDISYEKEYDALEFGKSIFYRTSVGAIDADLVLLMDVLEHVEDDVGLLKGYVDKVPVGSYFLISVPAFEFLWSAHDVFLDHKRRYRLPQMESVIEKSGLTVLKGGYYFGAVFPIAASVRLIGNLLSSEKSPAKSQLKKHNKLINEGLAGISFAEIPLMRFNRICGLTVFCLAQKKF